VLVFWHFLLLLCLAAGTALWMLFVCHAHSLTQRSRGGLITRLRSCYGIPGADHRWAG
jgi:hypothetical protein